MIWINLNKQQIASMHLGCIITVDYLKYSGSYKYELAPEWDWESKFAYHEWSIKGLGTGIDFIRVT